MYLAHRIYYRNDGLFSHDANQMCSTELVQGGLIEIFLLNLV